VPTTDGADTEPRDDLDAAIGAIYGGPLDEFVPARDGLARELRAAGRRDDATAVRKLAKPRRLAWALDAAVLADRARFEAVDAAAEALADAHSGTDVREATNALRAAARSLADAASERAAASEGAALDQSELVPAVLAVAADPEALATLRAGRLVDVPSAGAFGAFAPGPARAGSPSRAAKRDADAGTVTPTAPESPTPASTRPAAGRDRATARQAKAAERAAAQAESRYETARARAEEAADAAERAADELAAAEDRRRTAQREVEAARERLDGARRDARRAAAAAQEAEDAAREARDARAERG
jgi:hypothetical protein